MSSAEIIKNELILAEIYLQTATSYQVRSDLILMINASDVRSEQAYGDLEPARQACDLAEGFITNACKLNPLLSQDDGVFMLKMDAMFRRCELSVALGNWQDGLSIRREVLSPENLMNSIDSFDKVKEMLTTSGENGKSLARKFGVLAVLQTVLSQYLIAWQQYNFGIACISRDEESLSAEEKERALVWARQSAELFARSSPAEHARALALIANIQIASGSL